MIFMIIGYVLYLVLCGYLVLVSMAITAFTGRFGGEAFMFWIITAAAWYGAYSWWPFNPLTIG
jgi:hypothetical protein